MRGKQILATLVRGIPADHPRTCGENQSLQFVRLYGLGSPPHMRGKRQSRGALYALQRITPAHAGKTERKGQRNSDRSDHPRTCGENSSAMSASSLPNGSPPHMRGKLLSLILQKSQLRITPAHAGKTQSSLKTFNPFTDHPRTCGENSLTTNSSKGSFGSPPHMRGKLQRFHSCPIP